MGASYTLYALIPIIIIAIVYGAVLISAITCAIVFSLKDKKKKEQREQAAAQLSAEAQHAAPPEASGGTEQIN